MSFLTGDVALWEPFAVLAVLVAVLGGMVARWQTSGRCPGCGVVSAGLCACCEVEA